MSAQRSSLPDERARRRIAEELDRSMAVTAGAGTGKTTALVGRLVALVGRGVPLREIAAITFTEAAAAELRTRVAEALAAEAEASGDPAMSQAAAEVDEAAICTLHAFAQRILLEHGVAVGLPPGFEVLDEVAERADLEAQVARFLDELFDDADSEPFLLRALLLGLGAAGVAEVAACMHDHWDRLDDGGLALVEQGRPGARAWAAFDVSPVLEALGEALAMASSCTEETDLLLGHLRGRVASGAAELRAAAGDEQAALPLLVRLPVLTCSYGRAENWTRPVSEVREACRAAEEARLEALAEATEPVIRELLALLGRFTVEHARLRAGEGRLTFHDLLVHARRLLRDDVGARGALRRRYRFLLVDEFQDTDPLQIEVAARLASAVDGEGLPGLEDVRPGALFVVGDPKQSIYRFRRADIGQFESVTAALGDPAELRANFRSVPGVVEFVNSVFASLFPAEPTPGQAGHGELVPVRPALPWSVGPVGGVQLTLAGIGPEYSAGPAPELPPVVALGGPLDASAGEVRRAAARDVASALARTVSEQWPVERSDAPGGTRPARWRDIAVLIPSRTSLPSLEEAFDDASIPYRLEGAALLWGSDDVSDVLTVLSAADEPSDSVAVLAALRSPGLACGDDDLVDWRRVGGSWDPRAAQPPSTEAHPVGRAMGVLGALHRRRWWRSPSELLGDAMEELRSFELAFAHRRPRDHWHRLRWLAEQARLFDDSNGGSLHDFLRWAELQVQGDGRGAGIGPPDPDDDAVRVLTVHGAKGLEFPVVVVAGLERDDSSGHRADAVLWPPASPPEARAGMKLRSRGYEQAAGEDAELDRLERVRLLYVAMTRARDHLLLCLHHRARNGTSDRSHGALLEELCRARPLLWRRLPDLGGEPGIVTGQASARRVEAPAADGGGPEFADSLAAWTEARRSVIASRAVLPVVVATELAGPLQTAVPPGSPGDGPLRPVHQAHSAPARRSGDAMRVGRAVHGTLAVVDLRSPAGADLEEQALRQARAHGVGESAEEVAALARSAITSAVLRRAAERRHHREILVTVPAGEAGAGVFEGFVDLVFEDDDGLVVVDYKTDHAPGPDAARAVAGHYAPQVAAYAWALEEATGRPVVRAVLLFLSADEALEHVLEGSALAQARDQASRLAGELVAR